MTMTKLWLTILLLAASVDGFTVPLKSRCISIQPSLSSSAIGETKFGILAEAEPKDDTEEEPLTREDFDRVRSLVDSLCSIESVFDLKNEVLNKKDGDIEVGRAVVTPISPSHFPLTKMLTKTLTSRAADDTVVKAQTESIFRRLSDLLAILDDVFGQSMDAPLKYSRYENHPEFPDVDLSQAMKKLDGAPPKDYWFSRTKFRRLIERIARTTIGLSIAGSEVAKAPTKKKYEAFFTQSRWFGIIPNPFNLVPVPAYTLRKWNTDKSFGYQFMNGVNPLHLSVVTDISKQLTLELQTFLETDKLKTLQDEKRLFVVDYEWLADLKVNPHQALPLPMNDVPQMNPRYFQQAPVVVLELGKNRKQLHPLAIQLERGTGAKVYSKSTTDADTWMYVKTCVRSCDSQFHEWVSHLGKTHLTMEPMIIALHNTLRQSDHPLFTFFAPMVQGTLLLGWAARATLASFGANSFGDRLTSVGTGQFMQLIGRYWSEYDFFNSSALPRELECRGFTEDFDMPGYLYREDGMKLWKAYGEFAGEFVDEIFRKPDKTIDQAIADDPEVQRWASEMASPGRAGIKGFPSPIPNKESLVECMQTIWWICSGLHAAVNFPQYDFYGYVPNKPLGMRKGMQDYEDSLSGYPDHQDWIFLNALPGIDDASDMISTASTLTLPSKHTIDKLDKNFETYGTVAYKNFKDELNNIGKAINQRNLMNKALGKPVYSYLHPKVVPASIDI